MSCKRLYVIIKGLIYFIEAGAYKYGLDAHKEVHKRGLKKFSLNMQSTYAKRSELRYTFCFKDHTNIQRKIPYKFAITI